MASSSRNPFAPSTRFHSKTSPSNSSRQVVLPPLPELHDPAFLDLLLPLSLHVSPPASLEKSDSKDVFLNTSNQTTSLASTGATAHTDTVSPCLDAFELLNAETDPEDYKSLLESAWAEDPLSTVRLIFHLRSIHEGSALRAEFYRAFAWLYRTHPRSAIGNLEVLVAPLIVRRGRPRKSDDRMADGWTFAETEEEADLRPDVKVSHGYFKDLLNILLLETNDELDPESKFESLLPPRIAKGGRTKDSSSVAESWGKPSRDDGLGDVGTGGWDTAAVDDGWGTAAPDDTWGTAAPEWTSPEVAERHATTATPVLEATNDDDGDNDDDEDEDEEDEDEAEGSQTTSESSRRPSAAAASTSHSADSRARRNARSASRIEELRADNQRVSDSARADRQDLQNRRLAKFTQTLQEDKTYRALFIAVARIFAKYLAADVQKLRAIADGNTASDERLRLSLTVSLAAKWAPSIGAAHDRQTNISTAIAELLYASGSFPTSEPALSLPATQTEALRIRGMYTRWVLSPLRRFLQIPEVLMSSRKWDAIRYERVTSWCIGNHANVFHKRDGERFSQYLMEVAQGTKTIIGATMLPHELLLEAAGPVPKPRQQLAEAQWRTLVESLEAAGTLDNCLAVCDVSGSMGNMYFADQYSERKGPRTVDQARRLRKRVGRTEHVPPIALALALSLLMAHTAQEPWRGQFVTFSQAPELVKLDMTKSLVKQAMDIKDAGWGSNTDLSAVLLKIILPAAKEHNLRREDMVKRLFVFSDVEFDSSRGLYASNWQTEHSSIKQKFEAAGYDMPEVVYWNLQSHGMHPVRKDEPGTALLSGWSANMFKLLMSGSFITPELGSEGKTVEGVKEQTVDETQMEHEDSAEQKDPLVLMTLALNRESFASLRVL